jgi:hypothetical protein
VPWSTSGARCAWTSCASTERHAFDQAVAWPVWICLGLWPDGHGEPGWWARSDWPLWVQVVDPDGEQARRCWLLRQLYRAPVTPNDPASPLTRLWMRLAAHLPPADRPAAGCRPQPDGAALRPQPIKRQAMTYYVRGFCTDGEVPTIGMVLAWAAEHGLELDPPAEMPEFVSWVGEPPPDWGRWTPEELASRDWGRGRPGGVPRLR